jgi:hypothetical protein
MQFNYHIEFHFFKLDFNQKFIILDLLKYFLSLFIIKFL